MIKYFIYFIRIFILFLVSLPIFFPTVKEKQDDIHFVKVNILLYNKKRTPFEKSFLENKIKEKFGNSVLIDSIYYGSEKNSLAMDFDDLLTKVTSINDNVVIFSEANFFGPNWEEFAEKIRNSKANKENRLYFLDENKLEKNKSKNYFIQVSSLYFPKIVFINHETKGLLTLIGKAEPNSDIKINIQLNNEGFYLNSKEAQIHVPENGNIHEQIEIPVQFYNTGSQAVTASMTSSPSLTNYPLNTAFSSVDVAYSKTTVLHLDYAPDFDLRTMRWKLKFWPNLDLLSYYILREITSEQNIPPRELSLIEFPSRKLFGDDLPKIHGILAQNFIFENYLREKEITNLIQYIKNGGRMVIQAGPSSFLEQRPEIQELFPCENKPTWDDKTNYSWISNNENTNLSSHFIQALKNIKTSSTWTKCIPKKNALVLAQLQEDKSPVLLAMPLEKGIVVTFLSSNWLSAYTALETKPFEPNSARLEQANASDFIFQWMVEFLQRKQDSGLRPPELLGPRIYSEDKFLSVKIKDVLNLKQHFLMDGEGEKKTSVSAFRLKNLSSDVIQLEAPLNSVLKKNKTFFNLQKLTLNPENRDEKISHFKLIPVIWGKEKDYEKNSNPYLFDGIPNFNDLNSLDHESEKNNLNSFQNIPLLIAYPWLLAFSLILLALEQLLSLIFL